MKTELTDVSPTRKELKIEIDADAVRAEYDRISDRYAQAATVPGFRRGRAPRAVVRQRFKNEIRSEVLRELVPQAISEAITENALNVIGEPDIHLDDDAALERLGEGPLAIHAHVEVLPAVTLGEYRGLETARRVRPVTEEAVERMIADLREASAALQPVEERGAALGDTVTVNFRGRHIRPPAEEDINVQDVDVVLGGAGVVEAFTDNLLGMRPEETKTFTVTYPEDFSSKGLAGKEIEYTAEVTAVRVKELPELDDEWAKSLGEEITSVAGLRERVRTSLAERAKYESEHRLRDDVMSKLVAAHPFEVPQTLLDYQTRRLLESTVRDMMGRGMDPRSPEMNWEGLGEMLRGRADEDLRASILLERIADQEDITTSEEEIEAELQALAASSQQSVEQVRAALTKQGGERSIVDRLRHRKALDLLVENARVRDEEWRDEEAAAVPAATVASQADDAPTSDQETNVSASAEPHERAAEQS